MRVCVSHAETGEAAIVPHEQAYNCLCLRGMGEHTVHSLVNGLLHNLWDTHTHTPSRSLPYPFLLCMCVCVY